MIFLLSIQFLLEMFFWYTNQNPMWIKVSVPKELPLI
jgi:hypothetical protein